jgi:hypothetical protein
MFFLFGGSEGILLYSFSPVSIDGALRAFDSKHKPLHLCLPLHTKMPRGGREKLAGAL